MAVRADVGLGDFDLGSLDFCDQPARERDRAFAVLRRQAPISHHQPLEDILGVTQRDERGYWAVVCHDDIRRVSRDPATFCSSQGVQFGDAPREMLEASQSFLAMDAPRHSANARRVVDEAAPTSGGDFVGLIAKRLPLITISDMIGVPEGDRERVVHAADVLVTVSDPEVSGDKAPLQALGEALWSLTEFAKELAGHRERQPGGDLMTGLVQAEVDGESSPMTRSRRSSCSCRSPGTTRRGTPPRTPSAR